MSVNRTYKFFLLVALVVLLCLPAFAQPPVGREAYEELLNGLCNKYGGTYWGLQEGPVSSGPNAGIVKDMRGLYPGAVSGTTYYWQVTVSGTLNPDATGTYTVGGMFNGYPFYYSSGNVYYLYHHASLSVWILRQYPNIPSGPDWYGGTTTSPVGTYTPEYTATGTATVANVTSSGIYLFVPSGVTLQSTGPFLCSGEAKAAAFDGGNNTIITCPNAGAMGRVDSTFSMWVNVNSASSTIGRLVFNATGKQFYLNGLTTLRCSADSGATLLDTSAGVITNNTWVHVAFVYVDGTQHGIVYVNGINVKSGAVGRAPASPDSTFGLGNRPSLSRCFTGSLAYCAVFPVALTASEIKQLATPSP